MIMIISKGAVCILDQHITTVRILNFMVYKISWISWYASDLRKFHKTILELLLHTRNLIRLHCQTTKVYPRNLIRAQYYTKINLELDKWLAIY